MNIVLPLILLIIANLVLYWIFFGKTKHDKLMQNETKMSGIFGSEVAPFNKDQLIVPDSKKNKSNMKKVNKVNKVNKSK